MKKFWNFKIAALILATASMFASCQKEPSAPERDVIQSESGEIGIKTAETVTGDDERNWGSPMDWLSATGSLSHLLQGSNLPLKAPSYFVNIPSGIKVTSKSFVYLTFIGQSANYNNVLGYYTYNEGDLTGDLEADRAYILDQIFTSDPDGVNLDQVVYTHTKALDFATTFRLSNDGEEFEPGTVVGFYLLPNGSNGTSPKVWMKNDKPVFIATEKTVNLTNEMPAGGKTSHLVGQSACGDFIIAFEDLNSLYSMTSDEDYNDLVFVVGDNLESRTVSSIEPHGGMPHPGPITSVFGEVCTLCTDAADELGSLINYVTKKSSKTIYEPLFTEEWNTGYLPVTGETALYAKLAFASAGWYNTIGWFTYTDGMTVANIKAQIADGSGVVYANHIIALDVHSVAKNSPQPFIRIGGPGHKFPAGEKVGFFLFPRYSAAGSPVNINTGNIRFTTLKSNSKQAQVVLKAPCDNVLVAFEDNQNTAGDEDFNDVIFHVSDNNSVTSLMSINIDHANFFDLVELNQRYVDGGSPWN